MINFVGPLPPPLHGFSAINLMVLSELQRRVEVGVFNLSPSADSNTSLRKVMSAIKVVSLVISYARACRSTRGSLLYLGFSGGLRQIGDAMFGYICARFGGSVYVHHHSFAYINTRSRLAAFCFSLMGDPIHIVLCGKMGERLSSLYGIDSDRIRVLSNAAFLDHKDIHCSMDELSGGVGDLMVGFLSNITAEKGIFEYFDLIGAAKSHGLKLSGLIAGPVAREIDSEFQSRLSELDCVQYIGPVYGDAKDEFFRRVDVLAFPTRYVNEAEPVTIYEALSHGVPVVAIGRGCISGMVVGNAGIVSTPESFCADSLAFIRRMCGERGFILDVKQAAHDSFRDQRRAAHIVFQALIDEIVESATRAQEVR